ncbi:hypothetical protein PENSPDRAFT_692721 [Peniophora sp. CONT]|nr:hypothetical protein PENSPDRAFT_692721 [Peniophora sp. CONT]
MDPTIQVHMKKPGRAQRKAAAKRARKEQREAAKRAKWNEERKEQRRRRRRRERLGVVPVNSSYITVPSGPAPPPLATASTSTAPREPHPLPQRPHLAHPLRLPTTTTVPLPSFEHPLQAIYPNGLSVMEWVDPAGKFVRRKVTAEGVVLVQRQGRVPADSLLAAAMDRGEYGGVPQPARAAPPQVCSEELCTASMNTFGAYNPYSNRPIETLAAHYHTPDNVPTGVNVRLGNHGYPLWNSSGWHSEPEEEEGDFEYEDDDDGYQGPYDEKFYEDMERDLAFAEWEHGPFWDSD